MHREPQPVKLFTVAPMYRYDKPQKGRYREHTQWSVEAIGSADPAVDAELIPLYRELLRRLGVTQWELLLNSIGDAQCRPAYVERLERVARREAGGARRGGAREARDEPFAGLRLEEPARADGARRRAEDRRLPVRRLPRHFAEVRRFLDALGIEYTIVPTLVRGLDYYTRTTFEFVGPESGRAR